MLETEVKIKSNGTVHTKIKPVPRLDLSSGMQKRETSL